MAGTACALVEMKLIIRKTAMSHQQNTETLSNAARTAARFLLHTTEFSISPNDHARILTLVVGYLSNCFQVEKDDITLLLLDRQGQKLGFLAPHHLARLGVSIPFHSRTSIVGKSLENRQAVIESRLPTVNRVQYFEKQKDKQFKSVCIQKMMPASVYVGHIQKAVTFPVAVGGSPLGVVQVSRRWRGTSATIEFSLQDLQILQTIEPVLCRLFQGIRALSSDDKLISVQKRPAVIKL